MAFDCSSLTNWGIPRNGGISLYSIIPSFPFNPNGFSCDGPSIAEKIHAQNSGINKESDHVLFL